MSSTINNSYFFKTVSTLSSSAPPGVNGVAAFDVTGSCKMLGFWGFVTGAVENIAVNASCSWISAHPGSSPVQFSAAGAIGNAQPPFFINFVHGFNTLSSASIQYSNQSLYNAFLTNGTIYFNTNTAATGSIMFHILYLPLSDNSIIRPRF